MNDTHSQPPLSPDGQRRRDAILQLALVASGQRTRHRARRMTVLSTGAAVMIVAGAFLFVSRLHRQSVTPSPQIVQTPVAPDNVNMPSSAPSAMPTEMRSRPVVIVIERIGTDPAKIAALRVPPSQVAYERLDDRRLLSELSDAGYAGGVIVRGGRSQLWYTVANADSKATRRPGG